METKKKVKSIAYYFTQFNKNEEPCKIDFLKINDNNQSFMKNKVNKNISIDKINEQNNSKTCIKRNFSSDFLKVKSQKKDETINSTFSKSSIKKKIKLSKSRIYEKIKDNSFSINKKSKILNPRTNFSNNHSMNLSYNQNTINYSSIDEISYRTSEKIKVYYF